MLIRLFERLLDMLAYVASEPCLVNSHYRRTSVTTFANEILNIFNKRSNSQISVENQHLGN